MTTSLPTIKDIARIQLMEANLHALTEAKTVATIIEELMAGRGGWVVTHNLDHLRRLHVDGEFRRLCATADLTVADGMPLVWACRISGKPLPERVAGSNLILSLSAAAAENGLSVYLFGGNPGSAEAAAARLRELYPTLRIAGTCCPSPGFELDQELCQKIEEDLRRSRPDIVFVGLGSPKQERFIASMRDVLPGAWWLGIGISFSFVCGEVRRAPKWVQAIGLEWLHRLLQEPRRLLRRYVFQGLPFAFLLLLHSLRRRLQGTRHESHD